MTRQPFTAGGLMSEAGSMIAGRMPGADVMQTLQSALSVLQDVDPPFIPAGAHAMTIVIEYPPGNPGIPPHKHSGPVFGYVIEGEMLFELEGEPPRVVRGGEAFWEPGGDVVHYQDGNNRDDIPMRFTVTMLCDPGKPMLTFLDDEELEQRKNRRVPRTT